jgi:hypothetical protein
MNRRDVRTSVLLAAGLLLLAAGAQAEVLLTPGDFHPPHPDMMTRGYRGILLTRGESWEPTATTIPFPQELRGAPELKITVYFVPEGVDVAGDVCICAQVSSASPGEPVFMTESYCPVPQQVDSGWGIDQLGSSEIITPGFMSQAGDLLHIAIYRDTDDGSLQDTYPGAVWFTAIKVEAWATSSTGETMIEPRPELTTRPTPFSAGTEIRYTLPRAAEVTVRIFDPQGRVIERIDPGLQSGGEHALDWNARGREAGIYFVKMLVDGRPTTVKTVKID